MQILGQTKSSTFGIHNCISLVDLCDQNRNNLCSTVFRVKCSLEFYLDQIEKPKKKTQQEKLKRLIQSPTIRTQKKQCFLRNEDIKGLHLTGEKPNRQSAVISSLTFQQMDQCDAIEY